MTTFTLKGDLYCFAKSLVPQVDDGPGVWGEKRECFLGIFFCRVFLEVRCMFTD